MSHIIRLHYDRHEEMLKLLPWYAVGQLGADEAAELVAHLAGCAECQAELQSERQLRDQVADIPIDVERGWAAFRRSIATQHGNDAPKWGGPAVRQATGRPRALGWLLGAQAAAILAMGLVIVVPQFDRTAQYQTLGAAPASSSGNMIVVFRPETPERELRRMLNDSGARLTDGPTSTDAYVLRVSAAGRLAALAKLRAQPNVVLAEPIDASGPQ